MFLKKTKRILAFTLVLAMILSFIPAVHAAEYSYEKATSIAVGDTVLLVYEGSKMELSSISTTSTKYGIGENFSDAPAGKFPLTVVAGTAEGSFAFQTSDGKYLYWTSGNSLNVNSALSANTSWTVTFDADGNAVIKNVKDATRIIYWNTGSPRFACYNKTGQQAIQLYKKVAGSSEPSCDHDWGEGVSSATCTEDGEIIYTCTICGETKKETIKALGHNYVDGVCERCGEAEAVAPEGQYVKLVSGDTLSVGDTVLIVCESKAREMKDFSKTTYALGEPYTDIPNALYPLTVFAGATEGTLSLKGEGGYLSWSSGNTLILAGDVTVNSSWIITIDDSDNAIIVNSKDNARKLQWNASNPRFAAYTSSQTAVQLYRFETGEVEDPTVPTEPSCEHNNATSVETTPATCTEKGTLTYTCPCGESWTEDIPALGHEYNEGELTVAPDCVTDGTWTKTCIRCPQTLEEPIPAMGHSYVDGVCSNCGEAAPEVVSYKLITLDNVKEGNYILGAVRGGAYPTIYPATAKISTGTYSDWIVSDTTITAFEDVITSDQLPEDGQIIIFTGNNTDGFSIGFESDGVMKYLGYTTTSKNRTLGFSENYANILWTVVADAKGGFALSTPIDGGNYVISQNSTSTTAIRGYANGSIYTGLYLFAQVVQLDPENCPHTSKTTIEKQDPTCMDFGYIKWECADCGTTGEDILNIEPENHTPVAREDILQEASCMQEGLKDIITICSICNAEISRTEEAIPLAPHTYEEGFCTVCIKDAPGKTFYLTNDPIHDAEDLVIYHPASGTAISLNSSKNKLMASTVTVENGVLITAEDTAIFHKCQPDHREFPLVLQTYNYGYLTSGESGNMLFYGEAPTPYAQWKHIPVNTEDCTFKLMNQAAAYNDVANQALEFYKNLYTVYGVGDNSDFYFQFYTNIQPCFHDWDEGVVAVEPKCNAEGIMVYTCSRCDHAIFEPIAPVAEHDWVEATCTSATYCQNCATVGGAYLAVESLEALEYPAQIVIAAKTSSVGYATMDNELGSDGRFCHYYYDGSNTHISLKSRVWTIEKTEDGYALSVDGKYLAYKEPSHFAMTDEPYTWYITQEGMTFTITPPSNPEVGITYHDGNYTDFGVYPKADQPGKNYERDIRLYQYVEGAILPHYDNTRDDLCDGCGYFMESASLAYRSISLNGNIAVNFYMNLTDQVASYSDAYMLFKQEGKVDENGNERIFKVYVADCVQKQVRGEAVYCFTHEVAAKEMTDIITAQFFYGDACTEEYTYSVKTYADNQRGNLSDNQPLMNLLDAMLRYGAAAQIHFAHRTDRLADAGMETVSYGGVVIDKYPINLPQGTDLVNFAGASLILRSETAIRLIFKADPSVAETLTVTYNGEPLKVIPISGMHTVIIDNIAAAALDQDFTVTINDGIEEATVTYCPLSYCQSIRSKATSSADLMDVCAALYLYNQAANSYFEPAE